MSPYEELLILYGSLVFIALYPLVIILFVLSLNIGVYSWMVIGACLTPPTLVWYIVGKKREEKAFDMILGGAGLTYERMDKALEEWIKKQQQKKEEPRDGEVL